MRKRKELSDPASCLNKAGDDEMLFVLLGRDESAPAAVRAWIEDRVSRGKNRRTGPKIQAAERWIQTVLDEQMLAETTPQRNAAT